MKRVTYAGHTYAYEQVQEKEQRLKEIALDILGKCKSENLTISEFYQLLEILRKTGEAVSLIDCPRR